MYKVHGIYDNRKVFERRLQHLPRKGELIRLDGVVFYVVVEVVWCLDESEYSGDDVRVNIALEVAE